MQSSVVGVESGSSTICQLKNGIFVDIYDPKVVVSYSSILLSTAYEMFTFETPGNTNFELPQEPSIDVRRYNFTNMDILCGDTSSVGEVVTMTRGGKYTWVSSPDAAWDWDERVWVERLFHCMVDSAPLKHLQIVPAYCWAPKTYLSRVATLFSNITTLPVSPFQGMTDILLVAECSVALIRTAILEEHVCCEGKEPTYPIFFGSTRKIWPQRLGELLASMHYYGTCHYLNSLTNLPAAIEWTTYGIFTVRAVGCMVLKMNLDNTGCHVQLLYEGSSLSLGKAIEAVAKLLK